MMQALTDDQRSKARHALGLPSSRTAYRNYYVVGEADADWEGLVAANLARKGPFNEGRDVIYWLTESGARLALEKGEKIGGDVRFAKEVPPISPVLSAAQTVGEM